MAIKVKLNILFVNDGLYCPFQLWVPFKAHFSGQSLISIRICWAKRIWCEKDLDWDSTVTCFCRLGQNLWRCNFPTEKYRSEQNSKFQAKVGNSNNDWGCADGVLLFFIRCNCNSAHLIKTRCHIAKHRVSAKVIQMGAADEIACPFMQI